MESNNTLAKEEILLRDLELSVSLYKYYIEVTLKANLFCYGITGAILSFYLTHQQYTYGRWALVLPIIMSTSFAFIFGYFSKPAQNLVNGVKNLSDELKLMLSFNFKPLVLFLRVSFVFHILTAIGLGYLFFILAA